MRIIQDAIRFPVSTAVRVILLVLFGMLALFRLPVQLTPTVEDPEVTVSTFWPGASPEEIEREIIDEQEEQLKSVEGLVKMESTSSDSNGQIVLTFQVGTDLDAAVLKVSNRLEQVPRYPDDADKPVLRTVDVDSNAMAWFKLEPADGGFHGDMSTKYDLADDFIKPEFERVEGVAVSNIYGGRERAMMVIVDPARLAARQVTMNQLAAALDSENRNYSGGDFNEGKRRYIVRTMGEYESPEAIEEIVIAVRNGVPVYLRDVARAELGFLKPQAEVYESGRKILAMNAVKEAGANSLKTMAALQETVESLNNGLLAQEGVRLTQVYNETSYIRSAIQLVRNNLFVGGTLAIIVLLLFLRSVSSTFVVAVSIPVSIIGTFLMMALFGRTLNVISLAGMAFAVGMVVDNSIVVLENIYRHRQMGKSLFAAAHDGGREVWGAVLASTLTTIAVFVPVAFVREEAGQLFGDIAVAVACAVGLSLLVSITVIPSLSAKILRAADARTDRRGFHDLWGGMRLAQRFKGSVTGLVEWVNSTTPRRVTLVTVLTVASVGGSLVLMPKTEYLPQGNQNFVFGLLLPPPGYSIDEVASLQDVYQEELDELTRHAAGTPEALGLPGGGIDEFFFVANPAFAFLGASANEPTRVGELLEPFQQASTRLPGSIVQVRQFSIFERGRGEGRNIDVELSGPDLAHLIGLGREIFGSVMQVLPDAQTFPIPSLDLGNPEVQVRTHRRRAAELGITNRELGFAVNALVDGAKASDYRYQGEEIDLIVVAEVPDGQRTHLLEQLPIATPDGRLVTLGSVADISVVNGPTTIAHRERQRALTVRITPSDDTPLESAMETVDARILQPMRDEGKLGGLYRASLTGSASKLRQTRDALTLNLILALIITYLLMAALFESFLYPLVIMFSVPLAALGGFLGLRIANLATGQMLDVLTMLGFIILVGTVVNNAILIVHQSLNYMRNEEMEPGDAIREAVRVRVRPIFMSVSTSVFGMLPLVLFPGAGSELYRGLGSVVVGGLLLSTVFTLFLVPALFSLALDARRALSERLKRAPLTPQQADIS